MRRLCQRTGESVSNVDVRYIFRGVFGDGEGDCGEGDGFAEEPAYVLLQWAKYVLVR